jgi:hypothetical protein
VFVNSSNEVKGRRGVLFDAEVKMRKYFLNKNGKMEEDVKPEDEDGVDGRGMAFGLVRGTGAFAAVLPSFTLVSRMPFA